MKKIMIFGPGMHEHVLKWNSFYHGCSLDVNSLDHVNKYKNLYKIFYIALKKFGRRYDISHVHFASSYGLLYWLIPCFSNLSIISIWGTDINRFVRPRKRYAKLWKVLILTSLKKFDIVNVPSERIKKILISWGVSPDSILVMQYGIDLSHIETIKGNRNKKYNPPRFVSIRNFSEIYNIRYLVDAFSDLSQKFSFELLVLGCGSRSEVLEIEEYIENRYDPRIKFIGCLGRQEFYDELVQANYFVSIPRTDGLSLAVLEALACGSVGIVSDIEAYDESVFNGAVVKVPLNNSSEFSKKISKILTNRGDFDLKTPLLEEYDMSKNMKKFRSITGVEGCHESL